ncbi:MAG: ABC transporter ATP-binding protein [Chloroflexi bacterium]|nr:ABC transporter ATP-binding protein [Chloroflexota bacterium]MBI3760790.1 ABC transporter ATP-binding protein [Chloroflexota bacterium]
MTDSLAIKTESLGRIYKIRGGKKTKETPKELIALADVNLKVECGELFGLLGPNGAGKTTLIKILVTLLAPTSGLAQVGGHDVIKSPHLIRPLINMVSGGESSGYGLLTVRENLWLFAQFYGLDNKTSQERITELLGVVGMLDRANTKSSDLSTGLRQKMNIVRGFVTDPEILFLDEPTLGLDVGAAREVRRFVRRWVAERERPRSGKTVLLTTHYMVEADELCDRVAIIDKGRVLACDTPANLKRRLQREAIFHMQVSPMNNGALSGFGTLPGVRKFTHEAHDGSSTLELILEADDVLSSVVAKLTQHNARILNLQKREPTLEDVFVDLVGRGLSEEGGGE